MPTVNRNASRRADSSESTYSLVESMREFPDDAACLEHLWRSRYSDDGERADGAKCVQECVFRKYQTAQGRYNLRYQRNPSMFAALVEKACAK